eukprot:gnl/MRDRNA2_/MRDRNA2_1555_c0_seq1.p1 gnl/MRDRNA2_/MRDRNA2_1555_c0~~gnl/MRDRNA2_/MRDRNA2_1555_c0_seq1.p1  ORF type:complete len:113 (-),score=1.10 gnl/MRDRNA2_/MRDRNA2_1555_c0_seq1:171-509(-)
MRFCVCVRRSGGLLLACAATYIFMHGRKCRMIKHKSAWHFDAKISGQFLRPRNRQSRCNTQIHNWYIRSDTALLIRYQGTQALVKNSENVTGANNGLIDIKTQITRHKDFDC